MRRSRRTTGRALRSTDRVAPAPDRAAPGGEKLFLLHGSMRRSPEVRAWFGSEPVALRAIASTWFDELRRCGDDVFEVMHDGCPTACVAGAAFAYVNTFSAHVNVGFFLGAMLPDPGGTLEGVGKRMRHVKVRPGQEPDPEALRALVRAAYADIRARVRVAAKP